MKRGGVPILTFGKYQGYRVDDLPDSYLRFLRGCRRLPEFVVLAVDTEYLKRNLLTPAERARVEAFRRTQHRMFWKGVL
jgi:uncharacterized protein (DUF3820 family)